MDYVSAPGDYVSFYRTYRPIVVGLVKKYGIDPQHADDVASEIMLRFLERDFLVQFNPSLVFMYEGETRPARFRSFLANFVKRYCQGHRDKLHRIRSREPQLIDGPPRSDGSLWIDVFGPLAPGADEDVLDEVHGGQLVTWLRDYLATVPRKSRSDSCDLVALFDQVLIQIQRDGEWSIAKLRRIFNVSPTTMHSRMWRLRACIATALDREMPAKRKRADTHDDCIDDRADDDHAD